MVMNSNTTITLTNTITALKRADSLMPTTRMIVASMVMKTAGTLRIAPVLMNLLAASS